MSPFLELIFIIRSINFSGLGVSNSFTEPNNLRISAVAELFWGKSPQKVPIETPSSFKSVKKRFSFGLPSPSLPKYISSLFNNLLIVSLLYLQLIVDG